MLAELVGGVTLLVCVFSIWIMWQRTGSLGLLMQSEAEMARVNLDHIAGALVGLSELLEESEQLVDAASAIPSPGELLSGMLQNLIMSKLSSMAPTIAPLVEENIDLISQTVLGPEHGGAESETEISNPE